MALINDYTFVHFYFKKYVHTLVVSDTDVVCAKTLSQTRENFLLLFFAGSAWNSGKLWLGRSFVQAG